MDLFATGSNARCPKFFSPFPSKGTAGIDAFSFNWSQEDFPYACPPLSKVLPAWRKFQQDKASGVLVFPGWHSCHFWPVIFSDGIHATPGSGVSRVLMFKPFITRGEFCTRAMIGGIGSFFVALLFDFSSSSEPKKAAVCSKSGCSECS